MLHTLNPGHVILKFLKHAVAPLRSVHAPHDLLALDLGPGSRLCEELRLRPLELGKLREVQQPVGAE